MAVGTFFYAVGGPQDSFCSLFFLMFFIHGVRCIVCGMNRSFFSSTPFDYNCSVNFSFPVSDWILNSTGDPSLSFFCATVWGASLLRSAPLNHIYTSLPQRGCLRSFHTGLCFSHLWVRPRPPVLEARVDWPLSFWSSHFLTPPIVHLTNFQSFLPTEHTP